MSLLVMILFAATASAQSTPVRIARLPIIFESTIPDEETRAELETKIERAVHIPLNGTLQLAEYLPQNDSAQALNEIWTGIRDQNKKAKLSEAMRPLAQKIDADIIVCPVLKQYSQYVGFASYNETILISQARAELIDKKNSQFYKDAYSPRGTASFLSKVCFDSVIEESNIRQLIRAIRN